jgi:hypothetical protein
MFSPGARARTGLHLNSAAGRTGQVRNLFLLLSLSLALAPAASSSRELVSLAGEWRFALDEAREGARKSWFNTPLPESIHLPGTTDEARKGKPNPNRTEVARLTRPYPYSGWAWYQRTVSIPEAWQGKQIMLFLERTKYTTVWVDTQNFGEQDSLTTAHVYDLSPALEPGEHRLTLLVDNSPQRFPASGHQLLEETQTDWNGVVGRLELCASDKVWLEDIQAYPDVRSRSVRFRFTIGNLTTYPAAGSITTRARRSAKDQRASSVRVQFQGARDGAILESVLELGSKAQLWSEFTPALYEFSTTLEAKAGPERLTDESAGTFGLREFSTRGTQFTINGQTTFLRGKHDACVFPLTGYAPMDVAAWRRYLETCRAYGLNHIRFHTWCPPEAAFQAADGLGFYLQPELVNSGTDFSIDMPHRTYSLAEGRRILKAYGNHPSFVMLALGNETAGGRQARAEMVREFRSLDPRRLYAQASNYDFREGQVGAGDDYWTTMRTRNNSTGNVRGSFSHADKPLGHIQLDPSGTTHDYSSAIQGVPVPVVGHEVGQYQVFPALQEIDKYTGVLQPRNLRVFRQRLEARGMLDQDADFVRASGALAVLGYREEIETALRTRGFGGFQLLDLQDYPGQGTALVGILDAFMDSKGLISPEAWREFCAPIVPLVRFAKYAWGTGETFTGQVAVANYGPAPLPHAQIEWALCDDAGAEIRSGRPRACDVPQGTVSDLGLIQAPLAGCSAPKHLQLRVRLQGTAFQNHYDLWVYPPDPETPAPAGLTIARSLDEQTLKALTGGGKTLLLPDPSQLPNSIEGFFTSDFWCYSMFRMICQGMGVPPAPGTLGLLIQDKHPALAGFPTEFHSNWQWWPIVMHSRAAVLDDTPASFRPLVQVIDNVERNHKLGLVFEARVGAGSLLVCCADLPALKENLEARALWSSLLSYAASPRFFPTQSLSLDQLAKILPAP